jgi:thioredoxin reductase (NADPH)
MTGEPSPGMFVLIVGTVAVSSRDGLGHVVPIVEEGPGQFLAEIGQLSGRPALADARAKTDIEALLIPPEGLRRLIIAEAELGEKIMRALILRRVALIENGRRPGFDRARLEPGLGAPTKLSRAQRLPASSPRP